MATSDLLELSTNGARMEKVAVAAETARTRPNTKPDVLEEDDEKVCMIHH